MNHLKTITICHKEKEFSFLFQPRSFAARLLTTAWGSCSLCCNFKIKHLFTKGEKRIW